MTSGNAIILSGIESLKHVSQSISGSMQETALGANEIASSSSLVSYTSKKQIELLKSRGCISTNTIIHLWINKVVCKQHHRQGQSVLNLDSNECPPMNGRKFTKSHPVLCLVQTYSHPVIAEKGDELNHSGYINMHVSHMYCF